MKMLKYKRSVGRKKDLILTMEDDMDTEAVFKIFLATLKENEKNQGALLGIVAEKVLEESCMEQCENCQIYCPAGEV